MNALFFAAFLFLGLHGHAQYYYKDIMGTAETAALLAQYKAGNINRVVLASYDADNTRNDDFSVTQFFNAAAGTLRTVTQGSMGGSVLTSYTDGQSRVIKTTDSSETSISTTEYQYGPDGRLSKVVSVSSDTSGAFSVKEEHQWQYEGNRITGMLRIRNGKDTTVITFRHDENGNITEEHSTRNGTQSDPVYYYYNDQNRLTDIVRFNPKAARLLPEYMFEYNDAGKVIQRITFPSNSSEYTIWRYQYNEKGLRIKEAVYNKQKQLTGKIEYQYQ